MTMADLRRQQQQLPLVLVLVLDLDMELDSVAVAEAPENLLASRPDLAMRPGTRDCDTDCW
jgi:hypothetical protein